MKRTVTALALSLCLALPAGAQQDGDTGEGLDMIGRGAEMFLRGILEDMEPALEEFAEETLPLMEEFAEQMQPRMRALMRDLEPMLRELGDLVSDLDAYELPERLPNGDIIIRRKTPPPESPAEPDPDTTDPDTTDPDTGGPVDL